MKHTTLSTIDTPAIADAFNAVYEDYVMPVNISPEQVQHHIDNNDIALEHSPLWLDDDGSLIGMAMLGVRGDRGWVGGFGITKPYRGRGLSHQLIQDVLQRGKSIGLREIVLEVITTNTAAIRTYEKAGFIHHRDLLILVRRSDATSLDVNTSAARPADPKLLLTNRPQAPEPPSWQHAAPSLVHDDKLIGLAVGPIDAPLAMAVYLSPDLASVRIADLAAIDHDAAQTLLVALIQREAGKSISIVNEPEASNALPALYDLGWNEVMRQHEMVFAVRDA